MFQAVGKRPGVTELKRAPLENAFGGAYLLSHFGNPRRIGEHEYRAKECGPHCLGVMCELLKNVGRTAGTPAAGECSAESTH